MSAGRPKALRPIKHQKTFYSPGRYKERVNKLHAKKQKVEMLEALIVEYEKLDPEYVRDLKRRCNEQRSQLSVLSTIEPEERP